MKQMLFLLFAPFIMNATISISIELQTPQDEDYISHILYDAVNPIIDIVKNNLEQSGYTFADF